MNLSEKINKILPKIEKEFRKPVLSQFSTFSTEYTLTYFVVFFECVSQLLSQTSEDKQHVEYIKVKKDFSQIKIKFKKSNLYHIFSMKSVIDPFGKTYFPSVGEYGRGINGDTIYHVTVVELP